MRRLWQGLAEFDTFRKLMPAPKVSQFKLVQAFPPRLITFNSVAWPPNRKWLIAGAKDGLIWIFARKTGEVRTLEEHQGPGNCVARGVDVRLASVLLERARNGPLQDYYKYEHNRRPVDYVAV